MKMFLDGEDKWKNRKWEHSPWDDDDGLIFV
jgi:hypothetical protein